MNSNNRIVDAARDVRADLWKHRKQIWGSKNSVTPIEALDPGVALNRRGFTIQIDGALGHGYFDGVRCLIAGTLDQRKKHVSIASSLDYHSQRFTAAHELAHAVLHPHIAVLHRDVPLENSGYVRREEEVEANKFAAHFLMPTDIVLEEFHWRFGDSPLHLDEDTAFLLFRTTNVDKLLSKFRTQRDWSLAVARANNFGTRSFNSTNHALATSPTATAIRLEELGLVPFGA